MLAVLHLVDPVSNVSFTQLCRNPRCGVKFTASLDGEGWARAVSLSIQTYQSEMGENWVTLLEHHVTFAAHTQNASSPESQVILCRENRQGVAS